MLESFLEYLSKGFIYRGEKTTLQKGDFICFLVADGCIRFLRNMSRPMEHEIAGIRDDKIFVKGKIKTKKDFFKLASQIAEHLGFSIQEIPGNPHSLCFKFC